MSERFRGAMRQHGAPLTADGIHPDTAKGFDEFLGAFRGILASPRLASSAVHCDWLDNLSFNALATVRDGDEFIGIFAGAAVRTYNYFLTFLSDPAVLPTIGDPGAEEPDRSAIVGLRERNIAPDLLPRNPRSSARLQAAQHLAWNAVIFLFFHELAHIGLCHLRLLRDEVGASEYLELPAAGLSEEEAHLRVLLEIDADQSAALNSLRYWRSMWNKGAFPALAPLGAELSWSLSIGMFFRIMDGCKAGLPAPRYTTHPPPMVRYIHIANLGAQPNTPHYFGDEELSLASFQEVSSWWKANQLPVSSGDHGVGGDVIAELNSRRRELADKYSERLMEYQAHRRRSKSG